MDKSSGISKVVLLSGDYRGHIDYICYGTCCLEEDNMTHSGRIHPLIKQRRSDKGSTGMMRGK